MYAAAIQEAGGFPVELDLALAEREMVDLARGCDGVLLPGSPSDVDPRHYGHDPIDACAPADVLRETADRLLLEEAYRAGKPVLGICYGLQTLNVWRGGTLIQDLSVVPVNHAAGASVAVAHFALVADSGVVCDLLHPTEQLRIPVNSSHHQAISQLGDGLKVSARSVEDGVIEAIEGGLDAEAPEFVLGIQWHPERSVDESPISRAIFQAFVKAAGSRKSFQPPSGAR